MANNLKAIKSINAELDVTTSKLGAVQNSIVQISQEARKAVGSFGGITLPKESEIQTKAYEDAIKKLNAEKEKERQLNLKLIQDIAKLRQARTRATKKGLEQRASEQALRKELRLQVKAAIDLGSAYDNLSAQNNKLIRERQDLAIRQKTNNDLTLQETQRLEDLTGQIIENQKVLSKTDQEIGNFRRNVGNYSSAYDGLGNSINQITRELPAFTNSLQTGFLAISNNIPILADEIGRLNIRNKELIANGEPTKNVFKSITSAIFSWQTALSFGVTLLTVYGKELVEYIQELFKTEKQLNNTALSQENLNKAQEEGAESASAEITTLQALFEITRDITESQENRLKAADKIIELSNGQIKAQERLNLLEENSINIQNRLIKTISNRAIASALLSQNDERNATIAQNLIKIDQARLRVIELTNREVAIKSELEKAQQVNFETTQKLTQQLTQTTRDRINAEQIEGDLIDENTDLRAKNNDVIEKARELSDDLVNSLIESNDANDGSIKALKGSIAFLEQQIAKLEEQRSKLAVNSKEWFEYTSLIDKANRALSLLQFQLSGIDLTPVGDQIQSETQRIREAFNNISLELGIDDIFKEETEILKDELDKQLEAREDAAKRAEKIQRDSLKLQRDLRQEFTFSTIDAINDVFDNQIQKYENQIQANSEFYDAILENEELSDEQRKSLESQRDERERQLREKQKREERKAFLFNQALALAEIGLNLAQTITAINLAAAAQDAITPFAFGAFGASYRAANIPFAIGTAAAQTASVLAQTIPSFAEGGEMTHDGLMMINDHPSGRTEIVKRGDKLLMTNQRNAIVEGKKGDEIIPDAGQYLNTISDEDLISSLPKYIYNANISHQNYLTDMLINSQKQYDKMIISELKSLNRKKTRFNLNQNIDIGRKLRFGYRKNNTL